MTTKEGALPQGAEIKEKVMSKAEINTLQRAKAAQQKAAITELADYKKRVRSSNELKQLQVTELLLNIQYYKNKKEWMDLAPEMQKLEEREQKLVAEEKERMQREADEAQKASEELKTPNIVSVGGGKPRAK